VQKNRGLGDFCEVSESTAISHRRAVRVMFERKGHFLAGSGALDLQPIEDLSRCPSESRSFGNKGAGVLVVRKKVRGVGAQNVGKHVVSLQRVGLLVPL